MTGRAVRCAPVPRGLQATQEELTNRLGRAPKPEEVARTLGVAPETVHKLVDDVHRATVLNYDSLVVEGDAESFIASNDDGPEDTLLDRERKAYLMDAVGALPERLRRVVIGYFFEERSMQDLADELGVSESRISQLRAEALLVAARRRELATRARCGPGRAPTERTRRSSQGRLLRGSRGRLRLSSPLVGPTGRGRRSGARTRVGGQPPAAAAFVSRKGSRDRVADRDSHSSDSIATADQESPVLRHQ